MVSGECEDYFPHLETPHVSSFTEDTSLIQMSPQPKKQPLTGEKASNSTVKRPISKSSLMRQIVPLEHISTLLKRAIPKKPRYPIYEQSRVMRNFMVNLKLLFLFVLKILQIAFLICQN